MSHLNRLNASLSPQRHKLVGTVTTFQGQVFRFFRNLLNAAQSNAAFIFEWIGDKVDSKLQKVLKPENRLLLESSLEALMLIFPGNRSQSVSLEFLFVVFF